MAAYRAGLAHVDEEGHKAKKPGELSVPGQARIGVGDMQKLAHEASILKDARAVLVIECLLLDAMDRPTGSMVKGRGYRIEHAQCQRQCTASGNIQRFTERLYN